MKIKIADIPAEGLEVQGTLAADFIDEREDDHLGFAKPLNVSAKLNKTSIAVIAEVKVSGLFTGSCARCLETAEKNFSGEYFFDFLLEENREELDLGEEIRQEVISNYPDRILCSKECKGLCPQCGTNLNELDCGCPRSEINEDDEPQEEPKHCPCKNLKAIEENRIKEN